MNNINDIQKSIFEVQKQFEERNKEKVKKIEELVIILHEQDRLINEEQELWIRYSDMKRKELEEIKDKTEMSKIIIFEEIKVFKQIKNYWIKFRNENSPKDKWIKYLVDEGEKIWPKVSNKIEQVEEIISMLYEKMVQM